METKVITIFDSQRTINMEELKEYCSDYEIKTPKENSEAYWELINRIREDEWEYFEEDVKHNFEISDEYFILTGSLGLWDGRHEIAAHIFSNLWNAIMRCNGRDINDLKVTLDSNGIINVYAYHHDGCNCFEIHALSKKGIEFAKRNIEVEGYKFYWKNQTYLFRKIKPEDLCYSKNAFKSSEVLS
jgi:hypothetical protein